MASMWAWVFVLSLASGSTAELVVGQSVGEKPVSDDVLVKLGTLVEESLQVQQGPDASAELSPAAKTLKLARARYFDLKFAASEKAALAALEYLDQHPEEPNV